MKFDFIKQIQQDTIVVVPFFEEEKAFEVLLKQLSKAHSRSLFVIAVDDGSISFPCSSQSFCDNRVDGLIIKLKRNVGHQYAISIALTFLENIITSRQKIIVMDSDGEDNPDDINQLLSNLNGNDFTVCVAERRSRVESLSFKVGYFFYRIVFFSLTGRVIKFGNFMAFQKNALSRINSMGELSTHLASTVLKSKLPLVSVAVDRSKRYDGKSKMSLINLSLHAFRALMVFGTTVMVRIGFFCFLLLLGCTVASLLVVILKFFGVTMPGWASLFLGLISIIFLQALLLSVILLLFLIFSGSNDESLRFEKSHRLRLIKDVEVC